MAKEKVKKTKRKYYRDYSLIFVVLFLTCFGLLMVYSTSYYSAGATMGDSFYYLRKQAIFSGIGVVIMIGISFFDYKWIIKKFSVAAFAISGFLMVLVNFTPLGIERNGRKRWIGIGNTTLFQPTELVKLSLIMIIVWYFGKHRNNFGTRKSVLAFCGALAIPTFFVTQNNLSSGIIIFLITIFMFYIATSKPKYFWIAGICGVFLIFVGLFVGDIFVKWGILKEYQLSRINVWRDPSAYASSGGYQVLQGLYAIGSGGLFGKGLGNSTQKLGFIPEAQNDMIFSIICEEMGIFGAICLIALFAFLFYRMIIIAKHANDKYGFFLVAGVTCHLAIQVVLNIAVVTNTIPNTGVSLPFISYGGSSVFFLMSEIGLVLSVAHSIPMREKETEAEAATVEQMPVARKR